MIYYVPGKQIQMLLKKSGQEGSKFWEERPFSEKMKSVASGRVKALIPEVYGEQKR